MNTFRFSSIEQLGEVTKELNWSTDYRQLQAGTFSSTFTVRESEPWFLLEEQTNLTVEVQAESPKGMYVMALVQGDASSINGQVLDSSCILLQKPGADLRATLREGLTATQIGVDAEYFEQLLCDITPGARLPDSGISVLRSTATGVTAVRQAMRQALSTDSLSSITRDETVDSVLADLVSLTAGQRRIAATERLHRDSGHRALSRARDYIEANLNKPVRISDVCSYASTSQRSLQRLFIKELSVSPQQYILARRLSAARYRLLKAGTDDGLLIKSVAHDYGFRHMGRFSAFYRSYFGETPLETLNSS